MKWERKTINDLCEIKGGKRLPKNHELIETETNHPYIRARDIGKGIIDFSKPVFLQESTFNFISRYVVKRDDIVLTIVGANIGDVGLIPKELDGANLTENAVKLTSFNDNCHFKYLLYYFLLPGKKKQLEQVAAGSAQGKLGLYKIKDIEVPIPPLPIQRKIASILSAYDDLIENNLKRIKLLEEKAFLRYKGIVREEKLEKIKLKEVAILNKESLKTNSDLDKILYVDIASVSTGSIDNKTEFDSKEAPGRAKRILKHQDIIWSCVRPNRKSYSFVWKPEGNLIASTGFAVITAKAVPATFLYQLVTANDFVNYLENHAKGATYPAVTASDFEEAIIQIAPNSVMLEYSEEANQCFELKHILQNQNSKLREARDILLPKLMNGQIEV